MVGSLVILLFFALGTLVGFFGLLPFNIHDYNASEYTLYLLMFLVGIGIGADERSFSIFRQINWKILSIPIITIVGTFVGVSFSAIFLSEMEIRDIWAIGAGYGYYSLSSIYIAELRTEALGAVALLANIMREILTLVLTPLFAKYFGKLAPISAGGATSMDTTLPIITKYTGHEYAIISVFHGTVLTILVPIIVTFFAA
jgi:uncharacterized membrane protein YbjE (DUF340 family)